MYRTHKHARATLAAENHGGARPSLTSAFRALMDEAANALTHRSHTPAGMNEPTVHLSVPAARSLVACLKTENLPSLFDDKGNLRRTPDAAPAGTTVKFDAGLVAGSRVAKAGAHVLVFPDSIKPHISGRGDIILESIPTELRNIEAAVFSTVDVDSDDDAPTTFLPVFSAGIDWKDSIHKGVRFEIKRSQRRKIDPDQLCAEIVASLTLGLARAADEVLLSALRAKSLATFSIARAAAEGLLFDELRGLIGTAGAGATVDQSGNLRAGGIASELTADIGETIVGAWNRAGVAINADVSVHFERLDTAGSLAVTAWASMLPMVPDSTKFWFVS